MAVCRENQRRWRRCLGAIGGGALEVAGFELVYVTAPGDGVRVGLADAWALRLESVPPVRRFASYRGQRHLSGCWWSATDIGQRVSALAGPSEVLVSSTVKDLVAGPGIRFTDRGAHVLKGVPDQWRVFAVEN